MNMRHLFGVVHHPISACGIRCAIYIISLHAHFRACVQCLENQPHAKELKIHYETADFLIIQLKRYMMMPSGRLVKCQTPIYINW